MQLSLLFVDTSGEYSRGSGKNRGEGSMFGECHGHIFMNGSNYIQARDQYRNGPVEADIRSKLSAYQNAGVTCFRDGGDRYGASLLARALAPGSGIDYRTPGFALHHKGHYGGIVGFAFETMEEYRHLVDRVKEAGGDFIKVMFSGIIDFSGAGNVTEEPLSSDEIREMVHIAHEEGFSVMAHVNGARAVYDAIEAGTDSIEHGYFMDEECLAALAGSGSIWVPTISTVHNPLLSDRFPEKVMRRLDEDQAERIGKAWNMGCRIALGSDAGAFMVPHPDGIKTEYERICRIVGEGPETDRRLCAAEEEIRSRFRAC